jgi:hypothetical protein
MSSRCRRDLSGYSRGVAGCKENAP